MWTATIHGLTLFNIENTGPFQKSASQKAVAHSCGQYVVGVIEILPWYYKYPMQLYAFGIGSLCILFTFHTLNNLSSKKRGGFLKVVSKFPFYGLLNKLVRSLSFMKLFDELEKEGSPLA